MTLSDLALSEGRPRRRRALRPVHLNRVMTAYELADYFNVSTATIYRNSAQLPHFRVGTELRFLQSAIREYMEHSK